MQTFEHYRLINEITGRIIYFLSIDSEQKDYEDRKYRKLREMSNRYNIPEHKLFWESYKI